MRVLLEYTNSDPAMRERPEDWTTEELWAEIGRLHQQLHHLECRGVFSLDRDPFALMPVIDAYADGVISGGKARSCIRRWLAGADFRDPRERDWE